MGGLFWKANDWKRIKFLRNLALGPIVNGKICLPYLLSKFHSLSCSINFSYMIKIAPLELLEI